MPIALGWLASLGGRTRAPPRSKRAELISSHAQRTGSLLCVCVSVISDRQVANKKPVASIAPIAPIAPIAVC